MTKSMLSCSQQWEASCICRRRYTLELPLLLSVATSFFSKPTTAVVIWREPLIKDYSRREMIRLDKCSDAEWGGVSEQYTLLRTHVQNILFVYTVFYNNQFYSFLFSCLFITWWLPRPHVVGVFFFASNSTNLIESVINTQRQSNWLFHIIDDVRR